MHLGVGLVESELHDRGLVVLVLLEDFPVAGFVAEPEWGVLALLQAFGFEEFFGDALRFWMGFDPPVFPKLFQNYEFPSVTEF